MCYSITRRDSYKVLVKKTNITLSDLYSDEINRLGEANTNLVNKLYSMFLFNTFVISGVMSVASALTKSPIALTYNENNMSNTYWAFVFFIDLNFLIYQSFCTVGMNGMFIFLVTHIVSEMKMLNRAVSTGILNNSNFNILVGYHDHLLRFAKDTVDIYSSILLVEYLLNVGSLCFNLFLWTMDGIPPDAQHTSDYGVIALYNVTVLAYFSYAGDVMTEQCAALATKFFHELSQEQIACKKTAPITMVIQRAQKKLTFTIGGFNDLNLITFSEAITNCIRVVMFFNAIKTKKDMENQ